MQANFRVVSAFLRKKGYSQKPHTFYVKSMTKITKFLMLKSWIKRIIFSHENIN